VTVAMSDGQSVHLQESRHQQQQRVEVQTVLASMAADQVRYFCGS
jgi:hypothetical protein